MATKPPLAYMGVTSNNPPNIAYTSNNISIDLKTATLSAGTVTIAYPNVTASTRILPVRISANGSTALGSLTYSISAGASFTITAVQLASPGSTQTNDVSTIYCLVFNGA